MDSQKDSRPIALVSEEKQPLVSEEKLLSASATSVLTATSVLGAVPFHHKEIQQTSRMDNEAARKAKEITIEIADMLSMVEHLPSCQPCIYRVPKKLRELKKEAYTPRLVSIGPFHRGNKNLKSMDQAKKRFMKNLCQRNGIITSLTSCVEFVMEWEERIRECYSESIDMGRDEFVKMILVDSCFIIELFISYHNEYIDKDYSQISVPWVLKNIKSDLILLENQIPFFFLKEFFNQFTLAHFNSRSFLDLSLSFFGDFIVRKEKPTCELVKHFTDLVLASRRPLKGRQSSSNKIKKFTGVYSSTELNEAGVKFEKISSECLFDIDFTKYQVLQIPSFTLDDYTEILFRNLMALELYCYPNDSFITDYVILMDCLINTTRDVDLLVHKKIIKNYLGDNKAVADLFNNLCINIVFIDANFYFSEVCERLNAHYEKPWHKWKAMMNRDYFRTPWHIASSIAAVTLLVLTFILTVLSIISTVKSLLPLRMDPTPPEGIYI